jgi:signal transduction histidine kinase
MKQNRLPEAIDLLTKDIARLLNNRVFILRDYKLIAELYKKMGKGNEAAAAYAIYVAKLDSLQTDQEKFRSITFEAEQQLNEKELSIASLESKNKIASLTRNFLMGIAALLLLIAAGIYSRFQFKKKANKVLEKTLVDLKSTQSQLIQSEKMASLGELTAGIAHEIQNPLNFVNNFSEVNIELIAEAHEALGKHDLAETGLLLNNLKDNEEKIRIHGMRADGIVKAMLQHSRTGSEQKEPADINDLCDEYLRLAYHGLRAKDNSFNAFYKTDLDPHIGTVNVMPQEIGRVLLNLINNAFYAVAEKSKTAGTGYQPTVTVTTKAIDDKVHITVSDNGNGIPDAIREKIFQPFFTTKPTGQGTGLGLSLSYDIVKAHGGELKVETKEREGSSFIIQIPA